MLYTTPKQLKELLFKLKNENFANLSDIDVNKLINGMLENIGSIDPDLRDELIYGSFHIMFLKTNVLNDYFRDILNVCTNNDHLFYKIGEQNSDSVFTRSFSVLLIPLILYKHRK